MDKKALVSIIIPVYNTEKYLSKCLNSVINQTLKEIEILCVDDGSSDGSLDILNKYAAKDKRVKVFSQKNSGSAKARSMAISQATGDYIMFLDSDDWYELNACEVAFNAIVARDSDILIYGNYVLDQKGNISLSKRIAYVKKCHENHQEVDLSRLQMFLWDKIYKRSFLVENGIEMPTTITLAEDQIFNYLCEFHTDKYSYIDTPLITYRKLREGAMTTDINGILYDLGCLKYISQLPIYKIQPLDKQLKIVKNFLESQQRNVKKWNKPELQKRIRKDINKFLSFCEKRYSKKDLIKIGAYQNLKAYQKTKSKTIHSFLQNVFSIKNKYSQNQKRKVITFLGIKFTLKCKNNKKIRKQYTPTVKTNFGQIIAVTGYYYSGSSAVVGLFNEFDNVDVLGYNDSVYSVSPKQNQATNNLFRQPEVSFFYQTQFFDFVNSFDSKDPLTQDISIKRFIADIYRCYDNKGASDNDYCPTVYTEEFLKISFELLYKTLSLDEYTIEFMKDKRFPFIYNEQNNIFENCSFMQGKGISQYLFYQFKNISVDEFEQCICDYVNSFFNLCSGKKYVIMDQLFLYRRDLLDSLNKYLPKNPIKEIGIYRDPRDKFLSAFRNDLKYMPRNIDSYIKYYKNFGQLEQTLKNSHPNRLMIRFEDLVLKYDETVQKILDFIGLDKSHHIAPKTVFNPAISAVNIGAWKEFINQDFMRQIEKQLPEYCYYPEKENLSDEAWSLLKRRKDI